MSTPPSPTVQPATFGTPKVTSPTGLVLNTHFLVLRAGCNPQVTGVIKKESLPEPPEDDVPLGTFNLDGEPEEILYKIVKNAAICLAAAEVGTADHERLLARAEELFAFLVASRRVMGRSELRESIYCSIDGERDYQDGLPSDRTELQPTDKRSVGEYLTMLRHYMFLADQAWTMHAGDVHALDVIRKIAGITVHCMEDNGYVERQKPAEPAPQS